MSELEQVNNALILGRDIAIESLDIVNSILQEGDVSFEWKPDNTPVSEIDKLVNRTVIERVSQVFPEDTILGEEQSKEGSGNIWVIDPIDGTQALEQGIPAYTICIARLDSRGQPLFSIVANPSNGDLYESVIGQPTLKNGQLINVSNSPDIKYVYLSSRMPAQSKSSGQLYDTFAIEGHKVLNLRSFVYSCTKVAEGKAHAALIGVSPSYEAASVVPMILGAGGKVTDIHGNPLDRLDKPMDGLVVSNGIAHDKILELIHS